jgi:hypothetical protein
VDRERVSIWRWARVERTPKAGHLRFSRAPGSTQSTPRLGSLFAVAARPCRPLVCYRQQSRCVHTWKDSCCSHGGDLPLALLLKFSQGNNDNDFDGHAPWMRTRERPSETPALQQTPHTTFPHPHTSTQTHALSSPFFPRALHDYQRDVPRCCLRPLMHSDILLAVTHFISPDICCTAAGACGLCCCTTRIVNHG